MAIRRANFKVYCQKKDTITTGGEFKNKLNTEIASLIHQNAQSLGNSIDKMEKLLAEYQECAIFCFIEPN